MDIKIEFNTDNAAFDIEYPQFEIQYVIEQAKRKLCEYPEPVDHVAEIPLHDSNGNRIGQITITA